MSDYFIDVNHFYGRIRNQEDYQCFLDYCSPYYTEDELLDKIRASDYDEKFFGFFSYCNGKTLREFLNES